MPKGILQWPRRAKQGLVVALDAALCILATWIALSLRLDGLNVVIGEQWAAYAVAPLLAIPVFVRLGLYRAIFRYSGQAALLATLQAVAVYAVFYTAILVWQRWEMVPRTLGVLQPLIFFLLVGASRGVARFWLAGLGQVKGGPRPPLLIYGAGAEGAQTALALDVTRTFDLIGFVDDDANNIGHSINGVRVFAASELPRLIGHYGVSDILLAEPSMSRERRFQIIKALADQPVHVRALPALSDLTNGRTVQDFRELDLDDLLARPAVAPDEALLARELLGQVVLVTGAGGSIGSELARQILLQRPRMLLLLDHNEFGLYTIYQEIDAWAKQAEGGMAGELEIVPLLGSVTDHGFLHAVCLRYQPACIYHAAAYKHVPMVECNAGAGILNNVFGTLTAAQVAMQTGVKRFVLVSTDKAVRPTNIMGASKRMAELVLQALAGQQSATCFSTVRFGNVLGSSGSVVPLFRRQIAEGGPLTVTHPDVTRYFMSIPEASQLVLQAGAMGRGGDVFVLDMGEPVRIWDLARRMVHYSGLTVQEPNNPFGDIAVTFIGLRPGEKLYEELLIGDDPQPTEHPRIMKAHEPYETWDVLAPELTQLMEAAAGNDGPRIKALLARHVQGYVAQ